MVEHGASHLREPRQVTRVNADGLEFMPVALELASDNDGIAHTLLDIVGVYEERAVIGHFGRVCPESGQLVGKRHDPRMCMRAAYGNVVELARKHVGNRRASAHIGSPRRGHGAIGALRATQAKLRNRTSLGCPTDACGLGGDERLEVDAVENGGFQELALQQRPRHAHKRFARKDG